MGLTAFAQRLKQLREKNGIRQNELAKAIGVTSNTISSYEKADIEGNGKKPTLENAQAIAEYFNVSLDWLCGRVDTLSGGYTNLTAEQYFKSLVNILMETSYTISGQTINIKNNSITNFIRKVSDLINVYRAGSIPEDLFEICIEKVINDYDKMYTIFGNCILSSIEKDEAISDIKLSCNLNGHDVTPGLYPVTLGVAPFDDFDGHHVNLYISQHEAEQIQNETFDSLVEKQVQNYGEHNPPKE